MNKDQVILEAADILSKAESLSLSEGANFQQLSITGKVRKAYNQMRKVVKSDASLKQKQSAIKKFSEELAEFKRSAKEIDDVSFWSHIGQWVIQSLSISAIMKIVNSLIPSFYVNRTLNKAAHLGDIGLLGAAIANGLAKDKGRIRNDTIKMIDELIKFCNRLSKMSEEELAGVAEQLKAEKKKIKTTTLIMPAK